MCCTVVGGPGVLSRVRQCGRQGVWVGARARARALRGHIKTLTWYSLNGDLVVEMYSL